MNVILIGPPGSGKGTQANKLASSLNIPCVSSGDLFREHQSRGTELGNMAAEYMSKGILVPDEITVNMVLNWIETIKQNTGFLLDGFPRTIAQAKGLNLILKDIGDKIDSVISLSGDEDELVNRLIKRGLTSGRSDESIEIIKNRQKIYLDQTSPLLNYYQNVGLLIKINGVGEIKDINDEIIKIVNQYA